jgi:hypothetical protein
MPEKPPPKFKLASKEKFERANSSSGDRFPTNQELLADLTKYSDKPLEPREIPTVSRRTRDFFLTAGVGSVVIVAVLSKVMAHSDPMAMVRLALTAVGLYCGLLWYIFYGVISRY